MFASTRLTGHGMVVDELVADIADEVCAENFTYACPESWHEDCDVAPSFS